MLTPVVLVVVAAVSFVAGIAFTIAVNTYGELRRRRVARAAPHRWPRAGSDHYGAVPVDGSRDVVHVIRSPIGRSSVDGGGCFP